MGLVLSFDDLNDFDKNPYAKNVIEEVVQSFVFSGLDKSIDADKVVVTAEYQSQSPFQTSGRSVSFIQFIKVRSAVTFSITSMSAQVEKLFDSTNERREFIIQLQDEDATFSRINAMEEVRVNDKIVIEKEASSNSWIYIGTGIGAGFVGIAILLLFIRRRRNRNAFADAEFYDPSPTLDPRNQL